MRESFILIILSLVIAVQCSTLESDTYNLLKDNYASPDEYKMPTWLPEYVKRASDINKKIVLSKLKKLGQRVEKRTSKAALSLMLQSKQTPEHTEEEHSCYSGK